MSRKLFALFSFGAFIFACSQHTYRMDEQAMTPTELPRRASAPTPIAQRDAPLMDLSAVFFGFDSDVLTAAGQKELGKTVRWLQKTPGTKLQIEGYCDERGSDAYNIALGNRRAQAVKRFLVSQGIARSRLSTVSFGRVEGQDEKLRVQNRRASFVTIYAE